MEYSFEEPNSEHEWPEEVKSACIKMLCELRNELKSIVQGMGQKNERSVVLQNVNYLQKKMIFFNKNAVKLLPETDFSKEGATIHQAQEVFDEMNETKTALLVEEDGVNCEVLEEEQYLLQQECKEAVLEAGFPMDEATIIEEQKVFDEMPETKMEKGVVIETVERNVNVVDKHEALQGNAALLVILRFQNLTDEAVIFQFHWK